MSSSAFLITQTNPTAGRFVPPGDVRGWDRYAYVENNPLRYADPSGHCTNGGLDTIICAAGIIVTVVILKYDDARRAEVKPQSSGCTDTLAVCFERREIKEFASGEQIDPEEFDDMLVAIFEDVESKFRTPYDYARTVYDTPFYTGNSVSNPNEFPDKLVCFGTNCYHQSAVNYVAQGMYSAASGQSLENARKMTDDWNRMLYKHSVTEEELYWLEFGYNYYTQQLKDRKSQYPE